jgi:chemotaxis protein MotB
MARKKLAAEHPTHERWLISYADFITLLFAFFVVMFASSQVDQRKVAAVSASVSSALESGAQAAGQRYVPRGNETPKGKGGNMAPADRPDGGPAVVKDLMPSMKYLNEVLKHEVNTGEVEVHMEARGLVISLHEGAFFGSGDDKILPGSYPSIDKIADVMLSLPNPVRLEGHTDSVPIHTARFESNWELSAARSIAMLNLLSSRYSLPLERCAISGYADTMPVDTNDTAEGRARNRRVDLVILNDRVGTSLRNGPLQAQSGPAAQPIATAPTVAAAQPANPASKVAN